MARRKTIDLDRLGLELLAATIEGTRQRYKDAKEGGYQVDAATISASVSLLKMIEAAKAARQEDTAAELEKLREQFKRPPASQPASPALAIQNEPASRAALLAEYGLADPDSPT
ncbi:hypothetical protein [Pseudomonas sp. M5]|uniref:hypothetical protein n=1 Tax=Pseudomonas sp. M5 TaxID=1620788 RepID=UPI0019584228|nr:hypothetical protein [Pseudomonas sp. M5]MBM7397254.1 hypothetical protein [Pseudomonas sp. M5]HDS1756981.1 hypothetical protein [Pseudomonas putida]